MVKRFGAHGTLKDTDIALLETLVGSEPREVKAGELLWREGETADSLLMLDAGWACSARYLQDGSRQLLEVFLPGDALGLYEFALGDRRSDIAMLTDGWVSELSHQRVLELFAASPRMAAVFFAITNQHQAILAERLVVLARCSARERLAHFLCECRARLLGPERAGKDGFELPLTQQDLADALGLSAVHVSRTFTGLADEGLVQRNHFHLIIRDPARLAQVAGFNDHYLQVFWEGEDGKAHVAAQTLTEQSTEG